MLTLKKLKKGEKGTITSLEHDQYFLSRVLSKGIRQTAEVEVLRNCFGLPILIFTSDTMIAISKSEANNIYVERKEALHG